MNKQHVGLEDAVLLRQKAEEQLKRQKSKTSLPFLEGDMLKLIHELEVHQIELEMQNKELVNAKEKAESAEEKYTELYDFAPSGYLTLSKEGKILDLNFVTAGMLGKERSLLINKLFKFFISENTKINFNQFFQKVYSDKIKRTCEVIIATESNFPIYVNIDGILSLDDNFCFLTLVDITERKQTEIKLLESKLKVEESENKFQQLVQNIDECFWLRDDNSILYVSPGFEKIWGFPCHALYENPMLFTESIHPEDKPDVLKILQSKEFKNNGTFNSDYRIIREDNEVRWVNAKTFPVKDINGKILRRAGIAIDITEKIKEHEELINAKKHAEQSDRLKSAFLANMSHEIRTPMNGILGFADLLKEPGLSGEQQQEYIRIIEKSGARMLNIINDIVDISKIEAGLTKISIKESNVNEQIEYIYNFFKPETEAKGLKFSVNNTFPVREAFINTDVEKLYAILFNLVKNAIKYTDNGSIEFGYSKKADLLEFYVKDTGIGVNVDRQEAIFERFIQADIEDVNARQGAGLGLAIAKSYVKMLGGTIWVESVEGLGSTFYFTLPFTVGHKGKSSVQNDVPSVSSADLAQNLKILIVEDDEISRMLIDTIVRDFSKEILKATTGVEAVKNCREHPDIDLILMDIQMPEMGGYEATRQIRKFNNEVVIIAQTAFGLSGDREKAIGAGCDDYISKPVKIGELRTLIKKHCFKQ